VLCNCLRIPACLPEALHSTDEPSSPTLLTASEQSKRSIQRANPRAGCQEHQLRLRMSRSSGGECEGVICSRHRLFFHEPISCNRSRNRVCIHKTWFSALPAISLCAFWKGLTNDDYDLLLRCRTPRNILSILPQSRPSDSSIKVAW
jgi:hypothetical protein